MPVTGWDGDSSSETKSRKRKCIRLGAPNYFIEISCNIVSPQQFDTIGHTGVFIIIYYTANNPIFP